MSERERLRAKSRRLRSEMRKLGPMIKGSVIFREMRCGKAICKCTRGEPHLYPSENGFCLFSDVRSIVMVEFYFHIQPSWAAWFDR